MFVIITTGTYQLDYLSSPNSDVTTTRAACPQEMSLAHLIGGVDVQHHNISSSPHGCEFGFPSILLGLRLQFSFKNKIHVQQLDSLEIKCGTHSINLDVKITKNLYKLDTGELPEITSIIFHPSQKKPKKDLTCKVHTDV